MITKKQFEDAYRKYSPSKYETFYMQYLSPSSLLNYNWPSIIIGIMLLIPICIGLMGKIFHFTAHTIELFSWGYAALLALFAVYSLTVTLARTRRIEKMCKEMHTSRKDYNISVNKYYYESYYPDIKDYVTSLLKDSEKEKHKKT